VVKKKSKNGGFGRKIVYLGTVFCIPLFVIKIIFNNINWLSVFAPIIVSFAIVLVIK